jgi:hypothetical protein
MIARVALLVALLALLVGCGKDPDIAYAKHFKATMDVYYAGAQALDATSPPFKPSMTRQQKLNAVAEMIDKLAELYEKTSAKLKNVEPTDQFRELDSAVRSWLDETARDNREYARVVREGSPKAKNYGQGVTSREVERLTKFVAALEAKLGPQPKMREQIRLLQATGR